MSMGFLPREGASHHPLLDFSTFRIFSANEPIPPFGCDALTRYASSLNSCGRDHPKPIRPPIIFTTNPARQNATAAMPCANTAKNGGVSSV